MKYFAGLDVSLQETAIRVVDEDGLVTRVGKVASEPDDLVRWLAATGLTLVRVGLEAGPLSPWLYAELRAGGLPAICIETRRMKGATAAMAIKTDRNDARAIAHAMRVGWFTAVHVKTAESQELRLLLSNRRTLLEKRVAIDNEVRGTLKAFWPQDRRDWRCRLRDESEWRADLRPLAQSGHCEKLRCAAWPSTLSAPWHYRPTDRADCASKP
jgi:transposase